MSNSSLEVFAVRVCVPAGMCVCGSVGEKEQIRTYPAWKFLLLERVPIPTVENGANLNLSSRKVFDFQISWTSIVGKGASSNIFGMTVPAVYVSSASQLNKCKSEHIWLFGVLQPPI